MGPLAIPLDALWLLWLAGRSTRSPWFREPALLNARDIIREANPEWWPTVEA